LAQLGQADSIVIDPHKHGLQPYGCGCVLFQDPSAGRFYKHDSPYTYFSSAELHLGEISLECSRPGAAAAALWTTQKLLPLAGAGEFASGLEKGRAAALALFEKLENDERFLTAFAPELDIVIFAPRTSSVSGACATEFWAANLGTMQRDRETMTCLRSVLMKPEHLEWIPRIWDELSRATAEVFGEDGASVCAR
jgi:glutamate/tyrosine decarboxylase-like PLP-dependent enzyme